MITRAMRPRTPLAVRVVSTRVTPLVSSALLLAVFATAACAPSARGPAATATTAGEGANAASTCPTPKRVAPCLENIKDQVVATMNGGDGKGLYDLFNSGMRNAGTPQTTGAFVAGVLAAKGQWRSAERKGDEASHGKWRVEAERGAWNLELSIDREGKVSMLYVNDAPPPDPPTVKSEVPLSLPFRGEWTVGWGGDRREVNQHIGAPSQRRAADLTIVGADGKSYRGDGKSNADFLAYGQEILAVADGTVVTVVDGIPENEPRLSNAYMAPGNFVVLGHTPSLFSVYAHLQPGSARVKPGQHVRVGDVVGLCGNSGNSSEPHLHFQLQDGPAFERSWGVEGVFDRAVRTRDGRTEVVAGYKFLKGDRVRSAEP